MLKQRGYIMFGHKINDRLIALLSYLGSFPFIVLPLFLIPLFFAKKENIFGFMNTQNKEWFYF